MAGKYVTLRRAIDCAKGAPISGRCGHLAIQNAYFGLKYFPVAQGNFEMRAQYQNHFMPTGMLVR